MEFLFLKRLSLLKRVKLAAPFFVGMSIVSVLPFLGISSHRIQPPSATLANPISVFTIGQVAQAQESDISAEDIENYAAAVLNIERIRTATLETVQSMVAPEPVPSITCSQEESVRDLSEEVQAIVVEFCETSIAMVEESGLTVERFNQITQSHPEDAILFDAIQAELVRLQSPEPANSVSENDGEPDTLEEDS